MQYLNVRTMEKSGVPPPDSTSQIAQREDSTHQPVYIGSQEQAFGLAENTILQTQNYSIFHFDPLNRRIQQDKLDRMYDLISRRNLLHLFPIVVNRDLIVIDGQHRLKVAQTLNTPIYFIVSDQMKIEDAAMVSGGVDTWSVADYLDHWCGLGFPEFLKLREFHSRYQWMTLSMAAQFCFFGNIRLKGGDKISVRKLFANGTYVANDIPFATQVCSMAMDFSTWVKFWKSSTFLYTIRNLASNADYDHKRMMQKMQYQSAKLVRCANVDLYIAVMDSIYNFNVQSKDRVQLRRLNGRDAQHRVDRRGRS